VFCPLKDFRRVATRFDKLAANYATAFDLSCSSISLFLGAV
jgi:hypothetical protein